MSTVCRSIFSFGQLARPFCTRRYASQAPTRRLPFDLSLYLVADWPSCQDKGQFVSTIMQSVKGGVSCVQLRDHQSDWDTVFKTAVYLKGLLRNARVPFFLNTLHLIDMARAVEPDGVFLEERTPHSEARRLLGQQAIIGIPVKTIDDVEMTGQTSGIDYISVKITLSKYTAPKQDTTWGVGGLKTIRAISSHRIVAIGGLDEKSAAPVYQVLGADDGIAMAGALMRADNPCAAAQRIQRMRQKVGRQS